MSAVRHLDVFLLIFENFTGDGAEKSSSPNNVCSNSSEFGFLFNTSLVIVC